MPSPHILRSAAAALTIGTLAAIFLAADPTGIGFLLVAGLATVATVVAFLARSPPDPLRFAATAWGLGLVSAFCVTLATLALGPTEHWLPYHTVRVPVISRTSPSGWVLFALAVAGAYLVVYRGGRERLRGLGR